MSDRRNHNYPPSASRCQNDLFPTAGSGLVSLRNHSQRPVPKLIQWVDPGLSQTHGASDFGAAVMHSVAAQRVDATHARHTGQGGGGQHRARRNGLASVLSRVCPHSLIGGTAWLRDTTRLPAWMATVWPTSRYGADQDRISTGLDAEGHQRSPRLVQGDGAHRSTGRGARHVPPDAFPGNSHNRTVAGLYLGDDAGGHRGPDDVVPAVVLATDAVEGLDINHVGSADGR